MNKFWTILLKILIVVSFIGIIVFVGIAIFNNQNIAFEAYSYIAYTHKSTDFKTLQNNITNNVKADYYDSEMDSYAKYINTAITELNAGIDYYIDYLVFEDELTKGEQDKLINLYDSYLGMFSKVNEDYKSYKDAYEEARVQVENDYEGSDVALNKLKSWGFILVRDYTGCYEKGSEFFKFLVEMVDTYDQNSSGLYSYTGQGYMIKNGLVDYSLEFVLYNINERVNGRTHQANARSNALVENFYDFVSTSKKFTDKSTVTNTNLRVFINNLNQLNIYEWAGNNSNYLKTLSDDLKQVSNSALTFYNNNFKE
ncbi:MAG: hypothetical protein IKA31_04690 [Clostridia bacterium]|nr:hypothetical protein [Clostridia bacterium]